MTIAYFCIIIAMFIPLFCAGYTKFSSKGKYDNRSPRDFASGLEGKAKRAYSAQMNAYEAFAPFAAAVIAAHQMHAAQSTLDMLAMSFITARIAYTFLYIQDLHILRSVVWFAGFGITIAIFFIGA